MKNYKDAIWRMLFDNYEGYEQRGYNYYKPCFSGYGEFKLNDNFAIEIKWNDLNELGFEYADVFRLVSNEYDYYQYAHHEDLIFKTKQVRELLNFLEVEYNKLIDVFSNFMYNLEIEDIPAEHDIIKDFIDTYLNDNYR